MDPSGAFRPSYDQVLPGPAPGPAPDRRPGSVRRTSHLDATRGEGSGFMGVVAIAGAARDLQTGPDGYQVLGEASLVVGIGPDGLIDRVHATPSGTGVEALVGHRIGFGFRSSVKELLTELSGSLLGLLVDDLSGAPAPSGYGAIRDRVLLGLPDPPMPPMPEGARRGATQTDVCAGWRAGGVPTTARQTGMPMPFEAEPPVAPDLTVGDPVAWHAMGPLGGGQSRRVRRMDLWREGEVLVVDAMFRDSTVDPDLTQRVVHEYALSAQLDPATLSILDIDAEPRSLPFPTDCPLAADSARLILGQPVAGLRESVRTLSAGPVSCTHLNDAMRSLADMATLAAHLAA
ncbi:MAG TPA: DUF2889 domain-containing protein [Acidimicrobiales bacterium]